MAFPGELRVVDHVPQAFAELVAAERPRSMALSGGDTARAGYELLAVADVPWETVDVFFGDERWVPVGDPDSNEGMARTCFLDLVMPRAIHSMRHAGGTIEEAAANYDDLVRSSDPIALIHLGLGPDGHTASLFPRSPALRERDHFVVATGDALHPHPRLTLTYPAIATSRLVVFTVAGLGKRQALDRVKRGEDLPAARVTAERVIWLVDPAAIGGSRVDAKPA
jgi:6-phosphogluconolactonase